MKLKIKKNNKIYLNHKFKILLKILQILQILYVIISNNYY